MSSNKHHIDPSELATARADNEITEKENKQFNKLKKEHPYLEKLVESDLAIKKLLSERLPRKKAPESLKTKIQEKLREEELQKDVSPSSKAYGEHGIADIGNTNQNISASANNQGKTIVEDDGNNKRLYTYLAVAACVLIMLGFGFFGLNQQTGDTLSLEKYTYKHFTEHSTVLSELKQEFQTLDDAEQFVESSMRLNMEVPNISNAKFEGVGITDFIPGYKTPYLIYNQPDINETIYIFTFDVSELSSHSELKRNAEAVAKCVNQKDYFVQNINGKHVVSWKWDDTWYAAISNHNGNDLASLVQPLN